MRHLFFIPFAFIIALSLSFLGTSWANANTDSAHAKQHRGHGEESNFVLRQVMQHLAMAQQEIQLGLLMNNRLMIEKGAKAIAHHPAPKGGIKPYIDKKRKSLMPMIKSMDQLVHGSAIELAQKADSAAMLDLQKLNDKMISGCISCHNVFRD